MITGDISKWASIGTGVGIEIRGDDLVVTIAKVRPKGVLVPGATVIHNFRERPAAEWGAEYEKFLKDNNSAHLTATILLPREAIIVRQLPVPGVSRRDLDAALRFQIDSLHPYPEDTVTHGWAKLPDRPVVVIGIARTEAIEQYAELFAEAGVRAASFTFSVAVIYSAVRLLTKPPADGFLVLEETAEQWEAYGESPSRPVFSALFDLPPERAVALAAAELRLDPGIEPVHLLDLLPAPVQVPEGGDLSQHLLSFATALTGACPWLALSANLLPAARRSQSSRALYAPTVALAALLLVMLVTLGAYGGIKDRSYTHALEQEIEKYAADAGKVHDIEASTEALRARRETLRGFRMRTKDDLNALLELTHALEPPAWVRNVQITRTQAAVTGEAPEPDRLLQIIDSSPLFRNSEYTSPISGTGELKNISIRAQREFGAPGPIQPAATGDSQAGASGDSQPVPSDGSQPGTSGGTQ